jgi:hypothetical protein
MMAALRGLAKPVDIEGSDSDCHSYGLQHDVMEL